MKALIMVALAVALTPICTGQLAAQQPAPPENAAISPARARDIALARVGSGNSVQSVKLKKKNGLLVYEFDIETPGAGHQEVRVDALTGAVVSNKHEDDLIGTATKKLEKTADKIFSKDEIISLNPAISDTRARAIAMKRVPNAPIKSIDLETERGILVWEVELDTPGPGTAEVLIDATTGTVLRQKTKG